MVKFFIFSLILTQIALADDSDLFLQLEHKINLSLDEKIQLTIEKNVIEKQIAEIQTKIKDRKLLIMKRLKALNHIKNLQWGELLLNTNLNDLNRNLKILKNLNHYDLELFKEYNQAFRFLNSARKNLAETEMQIESNIAVYKQQQDDFKKLEAIRIAFLEQEKSDSFLRFKGKLTRPLEGALKQEFGHVRDQFGQYYLINRGELYSGSKNSPVKSVGLGVVIFRDVLSHWRETLIVQHSDNYYSVYAGLIGSAKKVGDKVTGNEIIGTLATSELYFELRHYANAINPQKWYREQK